MYKRDDKNKKEKEKEKEREIEREWKRDDWNRHRRKGSYGWNSRRTIRRTTRRRRIKGDDGDINIVINIIVWWKGYRPGKSTSGGECSG